MIKNNAQVDFIDKSFRKVRFVKVNSRPAVGEHLTSKYYVDQIFSNSVEKSSFLRLDPSEDLKIDEQLFENLNSALTTPTTIIEKSNETYFDSLSENDRKRRDISVLFKDQDNEFDYRS